MKDQVKHAWIHLRRSPYQALAAMMMVFATFLTATIVFLVALGTGEVLHYFETRPQVTLFFNDQISEKEIRQLEQKLKEDAQIKEVKYVSQEEALKIYQQQNENDPLLLEMVTANLLPASLEISTTKVEYLAELADKMKKETGAEEVVYQENLVKSLQSWMLTTRKIGLGLLGFLGIFSWLIILTVVGMKVAVRREEVEILRLLGASNWYIRSPFVLEGLFYGILGAMLGWSSGYLVLLYSTPFLVQFLAGLPLLPVSFWLMLVLLGGEVLAGGLIGLLASFLAVKRYLR